jgi:lincosamide nucleotidyltransferase A/C/D/E
VVICAPAAGMPLGEVLVVLEGLEQAGCRYWLEGGWGVDALVGHQTREHRDLDVDVDDRGEARALEVLTRLGYVVDTDWRPNRVEFVRAEYGRVDVHPIELHDDGSARQPGLDGRVYTFPARFFTTGSLGARSVPCFSLEAQRVFHAGYPPRPVDEHDLRVLDALA